MLIKLLVIYLLTIPSFVDSQCYSKSSKTWICDSRYKRNTTNLDYDTVLNNEPIEKIFLRNYDISVFEIDNYPLTLRLLNASNNQFEKVIITRKNRYLSNLRQLILQSNKIEKFHFDTVILPESLEIISLANNRLEVLDARIFLRLKNLTKLDLRNNLLKYILPQLLLKLNLNLNNNPLDCQCTSNFYRVICEKSTNLQPLSAGNDTCMAPYYESQSYIGRPPPYLRYSTFTLTCPINAHPPPLIIWSTPFGNFTSANFSSIHLLSSDNELPIYITLTALAGPLTARTRHMLHAYDSKYLSVTKARGGLQNRFSCSGINMLGIYTHQFDFNIDTKAKKRALWNLLYTACFGFFMSLVAGALCVSCRETHKRSVNAMKTPPLYPTLTPNSASRTPPNFELNQWLSSAAANITGTLEQVRDKLRSGVQTVSEHMGQTMGRASEFFSQGVQHAGGTIRQAAETSAAYLQSFRETSQQRFNTMRVHTLSSLRSSGNFMRAGMNILTTQVNSLRDYCGVTTGPAISTNYLLQQQQLHLLQHSPTTMSYLHRNRISTINEDDESIFESTSIDNYQHRTPYAGYTTSDVLSDTAGIGRLETADNPVSLALSNFNQDVLDNDDTTAARGQMTGGIGTFHDRNHANDDELVTESARLIMYGAQRRV